MSDAPKRIQRKRTKGWRMPEGAIYVGRPTRWGNPFTVAEAIYEGFAEDESQARKVCAAAFRSWLEDGIASQWWFALGYDRWEAIRFGAEDLEGHDLACWCPLNEPCHADVLLELANR